jgi:hypothetical protein
LIEPGGPARFPPTRGETRRRAAKKRALGAYQWVRKKPRATLKVPMILRGVERSSLSMGTSRKAICRFIPEMFDEHSVVGAPPPSQRAGYLDTHYVEGGYE